jgi:SET domain-containing protein
MTRRELKVKRTNIGLGLFTLEHIPAKQQIIEVVGPIISSEECERIRGKYLFGLDKNRAIDGRARSNLARYINHSCRPNAEAYVFGDKIQIWSRKNIKAGEEITFNYGKEYFDQYIKPIGCKCEKCAST